MRRWIQIAENTVGQRDVLQYIAKLVRSLPDSARAPVDDQQATRVSLERGEIAPQHNVADLQRHTDAHGLDRPARERRSMVSCQSHEQAGSGVGSDRNVCDERIYQSARAGCHHTVKTGCVRRRERCRAVENRDWPVAEAVDNENNALVLTRHARKCYGSRRGDPGMARSRS